MEDGIISKFFEKPEKAESKLISTGIYKFKRDIFDILEEMLKKGRTMLTDSISIFVEKKELKGIKIDGEWKDAVYPWNLLEINSYILKKLKPAMAGKIEKNVTIKGDVIIGENTIIRAGSYIEGPVIIGKNCEIGPNTCIFPSTSIGDNVVIYPFSEIRNSIIMDNTSIGSSSSISNSVVGRGTKIESHFSTLVGNVIKVLEKETINAGRTGSFIGSDCVIGANVVLEAGTVVGKGCRILSNNVVGDDLPNNSMVI
jgi:glucose-1-phosphate thymidylyltransferase